MTPTLGERRTRYQCLACGEWIDVETQTDTGDTVLTVSGTVRHPQPVDAVCGALLRVLADDLDALAKASLVAARVQFGAFS